jgi:hypothetical protein
MNLAPNGTARLVRMREDVLNQLGRLALHERANCSGELAAISMPIDWSSAGIGVP